MHSIDMRELDGPRPALSGVEGPARWEEWAALRRLSALCFPGFVDEDEDGEPPPPVEQAFQSATVGQAFQPATVGQAFQPAITDAPSRTSRFTGDLSRREDVEVLCYRGTPISKIGIYYSQVNVYGSPLRLASIGGVCTHPDYQGQGLATRLLDHCAHKLTAEGARLMLISGTRGLYTRAGCVTAQDFEYVVLKPGQLHPAIRCSALPSLRPATEADVSLCAHLYLTEPVHFVRRVEEFTRHFRQREEFPQAEDWIVEVEGRPVAYMFSGVPWEYWPARNTKIREVFEYAGSRIALVDGLVMAMAHLGLQEMRLSVPWQDTDLMQLLRAQGIAGDRVPLPGHTVRIVNFPGLMSDLRPYVRARLTESQRRGLRFEQQGPALSAGDGNWCAIVRGREQLQLDTAAMTRLVMGVPRAIAPGMPVVSGALADIIPALFPLPAFLPGLNFR